MKHKDVPQKPVDYKVNRKPKSPGTPMPVQRRIPKP